LLVRKDRVKLTSGESVVDITGTAG